MMSGRYSNVGFRQIGQPAFRPDCPNSQVRGSDFRYPALPNSPLRMAPPIVERLPFPNTVPSNPFEKKSQQYPPPRSALLSYPNNQTVADCSEHKPGMHELNSFSGDLCVEALSRNGKKYYYNPRTWTASRERSMHARIIYLNDFNSKELSLGETAQSDNFYPAEIDKLPSEQLKYLTVSSTHITRMVSTEDKKTFFFDSERKLSVWEKPNEMKKSISEVNKEVKVRVKTDEQIDKSRPVSSTPVSGTTWFVVWTGDERVFYFDSQRKISVWERPSELINRGDVDKLIEKSPLSQGLKPLKKDVRKIDNDQDSIKNLNKEDEEGLIDLKKKKNFELLKEQIFEDKEFTWPNVQAKISDVERYKAIHRNSSKEKLFTEYVTGLSSNSIPKEKEKRINSTPRNREEEVKRDLSVHMKDRERERDYHNHMSAASNFKAVLNDLTKTSDITCHYAKKNPKEDHRWKFSHCLESEDREGLSIKKLQKENEKGVIEKFMSLLKEAGVTSKSRFSDFAQRYAKDERFRAIEKIKQKEGIFNQYISDLLSKEKELDSLKAEKNKKTFELRKEQTFEDNKFSWPNVKAKISDYECYKAIHSNSSKEK